jgi:hypothetical protein
VFDYRHDAAFPLWRGREPIASVSEERASDLCTPQNFCNEKRQSNFMTNYLELPVGAKSPEVINAVIEIPHEGINKYEYDKDLHVFRLDRNLYSPVHYPGDYGFIPSTLGDDGDPLDVLVLVDAPSFPGCVMEVRPIGLLEMMDQGLGMRRCFVLARAIPGIRTCGTSRRFIRICCGRLRTFSRSIRIWKGNVLR